MLLGRVKFCAPKIFFGQNKSNAVANVQNNILLMTFVRVSIEISKFLSLDLMLLNTSIAEHVPSKSLKTV